MIRVFKGRNSGFRVKILGLYVRYFTEDQRIRAEINIRSPFWVRIFKRNTIRICDTAPKGSPEEIAAPVVGVQERQQEDVEKIITRLTDRLGESP